MIPRGHRVVFDRGPGVRRATKKSGPSVIFFAELGIKIKVG
jgi:hypothetical protein